MVLESFLTEKTLKPKPGTLNPVTLQDSLVALESFVTDEAWAKHKLMMPIAKTLYDEDIVEEQVWIGV